jgi:hypothetical protein
MSKCGYCGGSMEKHMVLRCKDPITEELRDRINEWLVKEKDLNEAASIFSEIIERLTK